MYTNNLSKSFLNIAICVGRVWIVTGSFIFEKQSLRGLLNVIDIQKAFIKAFQKVEINVFLWNMINKLYLSFVKNKTFLSLWRVPLILLINEIITQTQLFFISSLYYEKLQWNWTSNSLGNQKSRMDNFGRTYYTNQIQ